MLFCVVHCSWCKDYATFSQGAFCSPKSMYLPIPPTHPLFQFWYSTKCLHGTSFLLFCSRDLTLIFFNFVFVLLCQVVLPQVYKKKALPVETNCGAVVSVVMNCFPTALGYFCYANPKISYFLSISACIYKSLLFKVCLLFILPMAISTKVCFCRLSGVVTFTQPSVLYW